MGDTSQAILPALCFNFLVYSVERLNTLTAAVKILPSLQTQKSLRNLLLLLFYYDIQHKNTYFPCFVQHTDKITAA